MESLLFPQALLFLKVFLLAEKPLKRIFIELPEGIVRKLDIIAKLEGRNRNELVEQAISDFVPREIDEKNLDKKALYKFLDTQLTKEELIEIIGKEKAGVAFHTKDIRSRAQEFLGTLESKRK